MAEKQQKQPFVPLTLQRNSYKIIIPAKVENMIRMLCSEVHNVEWSGALFYTYTGSFESNDLVITCQDICVMDIGTGGYTEFIESPIIISYQMEHDLLDCKVGLIHSHNNMPTFFSGTDQATLKDEGLAMNNFVSLIVNNAGKYTAAITRNVKAIKDVGASKSYQFFGEGEVDLGSSQYYEEGKEIQYFPLDIVKEEGSNNVILTRLEEIKKAKSKVVSVTSFPKFGNDFDKDTDTFRKFLDDKTKENATKTIKVDPKKTKEPTLFDDWDELEEIPYGKEQLDPTLVETAALQIVTGGILVTTKNKVNFKNWMEQIDTLFDTRFKAMEDFNYWADSHIDIVLQTLHCEELETKYDFDTYIALLAYEVNLMLEDYKESPYVQYMMNCLDKYVTV